MTDRQEIELVLEYHERTKHFPGRYAASLGYLDWRNQPAPFRWYEGAPQLQLERLDPHASPRYDDLFRNESIQPADFGKSFVSGLFYDSLALSAWKRIPGSDAWSLRVNPSSGNLHPTEAYLICGPISGLTDHPAVFHYFPYAHALELIRNLTPAEWNELSGDQPGPVALVGLTSIYWREAWKYGERAFRYCHHDVGHAVAAVTLAAASAGWETLLVSSVTHDELNGLLGLSFQSGPDSEHPDCLMALYPANPRSVRFEEACLGLPRQLFDRLSETGISGTPNKLSSSYHDWPIIEGAARACRSAPTGSLYEDLDKNELLEGALPEWVVSGSTLTARQIFRRRRSAVAMDGITPIKRQDFFGMARRCCDTTGIPAGVLPWRPFVSLVVFVHRVTGLQKGLYLVARRSSHEADLRKRLKPDFLWTRPHGCPDDLPLYLLEAGDFQDMARNVSCYQDIASDGAFSLGMLAQFEEPIRKFGAGIYPRLYWETGLIGQVLYLEAEARGLRGTGIGCFHDDMVHEILGLHDRNWQSLYHFTVGGALEDPRLETVRAYAHLG